MTNVSLTSAEKGDCRKLGSAFHSKGLFCVCVCTCACVHAGGLKDFDIDATLQLPASIEDLIKGPQVVLVRKDLDDALHQILLCNLILAVDDLGGGSRMSNTYGVAF